MLPVIFRRLCYNAASSVCSKRRSLFGFRYNCTPVAGLVVAEFVVQYAEHRLHGARGQWTPETSGPEPDPIDKPEKAQLRRSGVLGGLIHEYRLIA